MDPSYALWQWNFQKTLLFQTYVLHLYMVIIIIEITLKLVTYIYTHTHTYTSELLAKWIFGPMRGTGGAIWIIWNLAR